MKRARAKLVQPSLARKALTLLKENPKVAVAVALAVLSLLAAWASRETVTKILKSRTQEHSMWEGGGGGKTSALTESETQELARLRTEVKSLRTTASRYKKLTAATNPLTGAPLLDKDGNPVFNTDEGDTTEQEVISTLRDELDRRLSTIKELEEQATVYQAKLDSMKVAELATEDKSVTQRRSKLLVGVAGRKDLSAWASLGGSVPFGGLDLQASILFPAYGPVLSNPYADNLMLGLGLGF